MVQLLTAMLDVPLHERNALLLAAGYAPLYGKRGLDTPAPDQLNHAPTSSFGSRNPIQRS